MLFNSIDFAFFLPVFFSLYWFVTKNNLRSQNLLVLLGSYFFYGWWDWRFLLLIAFSTCVDFYIGKQLTSESRQHKRKLLLYLSFFVNLGLLGFFKYYNFFLDNFISAFTFFGNKIEIKNLNIILPVGISFYTFQTLSYTIDVYQRRLKASDDFIAFSAFVSFFPQLVAGPIERASNLLPQFNKKRYFKYNKAVDGLRQILWGLIKKIVIADNCAVYANKIFAISDDLDGSTLLLGAILFAFQIYGDFSGYSDIAIGLARLLGFELKKNFAFPYFSRNMAEFWRRWHISLSSWFKDYLYIPLGGSKHGNLKSIRNIFIIFIVSGFWHGASWNFIVWGALNALYFLPIFLWNKNRNYNEFIPENKLLPTFKEFISIIFTFFLTVIAWIFFRADNLTHATSYISKVFSTSLFRKPIIHSIEVYALILCFVTIEWIGRHDQYAIEKIGFRWNRPLRWSFYSLLGLVIFVFWGKEQQFIYFQF